MAAYIKEIIDLTENDPRITVIDFHASWCGPCLSFAPVFEKVATEMNQQFIFTKADVDAAPSLAQRFSVRSIPTLVAVQNGQEIFRNTGALSYQNLKQTLELLLQRNRHL